MAAASRIAAIGATRAALIAGMTAAIMVTRMPTVNDAMIADSGQPSPAESIFASRREQRRPERAEPDADDEPEQRPDDADEQRLDQHRPDDLSRLAPIARSSASSCVRWETMIENVFRIRNTPTSNAIAPKPSKK